MTMDVDMALPLLTELDTAGVPVDDGSDSTASWDIDCLSSEEEETLDDCSLGYVGSGPDSTDTNQSGIDAVTILTEQEALFVAENGCNPSKRKQTNA